jgi:hypothetical protein
MYGNLPFLATHCEPGKKGDTKVTLKTMPARATWLRAFLFLLVVGCGSTVEVASSAVQTGLVRQVFACQFVNGSNLDDLMAARDNMLSKLPEIGVDPVPAFVWTPFKGNFAYDVLWFDNYENLNAWGADSDKWGASPVAMEVDAAFNEVIDCQSGLAVRETIYEGGEPLTLDAPALITSSACRLNEGKNINDVRTVLGQLKTTLDGLGGFETFVGYMNTPITNASDVDVYFYGVHQDVSTYAARTTALRTSDAGRALGAALQGVFDCQTSLWWGQPVVTVE